MPETKPFPSVLIPMPQGMGVNGVAVWALRMAGALAKRGWMIGLMLHGEPPGHSNAGHAVPPGVRSHDLRHLPPLGTPGAPLHPHIQAYRNALEDLGWSPKSPAIMLPNLDPNTFAIAAALNAAHGDRLRVLGWQHSDTPFDATLITSYEPMFTTMVGVSSQIVDTLRDLVTWRAEDIRQVHNGVEVKPTIKNRADGPLRLLYTGRFEDKQKRIGVILQIASLLQEADIPYSMRLVGDGPAANEVAIAAKKLGSVECIPPASLQEMSAHYRWADIKLLASRYEGLSISMLEAMAAGVVPIVSRVRSGARDAIDHGVNGMLVEAGENDADITVAERFGDAVLAFAESPERLARMRAAAHARVLERFSLESHVDACVEVFQAAAAAEPRWWPLERSCGFDSAAGGGGSVPPDATERAAKVLSREQGTLAIYGAGRHTRAIAHVLAHARISYIIEDDRSLHGKTLWGWPIISLEMAKPETSVLVSSYMHQRAMADRARAKGLRVITLY